MATTQIMKVKVEELSKYGFKANGEYVNYSKQFPEAQKVSIVPGAEFEGEVYVADSGKQYLNKVLSQSPAQPITKAVAAPVDTERAKKFTPKFTKKDDTSMSKAEWQAKDRSQLIGGLSHDAAAVTAALLATAAEMDPQEALTIYAFVLNGMLKIRDEVK